jgi:hydrogenase-4 component E
VSLALALLALIMVAIAENARIPVDNPATHLELTMVHEAMVLEYSGRHLALIELAASLKLLLYLSLLGCIFAPWGMASRARASSPICWAWRPISAQVGVWRIAAGAVRNQHRQDAGVPGRRISGRGADAGAAGRVAAVRVAESVMHGLTFDIAHFLAGGMVVVSFLLLYQDRLYALLNVYAIHALVLALAVGWQAHAQSAPHLYVTAAIALLFKAIIVPLPCTALLSGSAFIAPWNRRWGGRDDHAGRGGIDRAGDSGDVAGHRRAEALVREDLAFALAVVLLGLLIMITRHNAVSQVVGFMSLENGLVLAATGARGMPLVVEISVAFSVLIALIVIGVFLFRIRERFDSVDMHFGPFPGETPPMTTGLIAVYALLLVPISAALLLLALSAYQISGAG